MQTRTGAFAGVPYLLKDLAVEYAGVRFTEGSRFFRDNVSAHDQELTVRLRAAGLIVLGKTNTCEFGMAPACEPVLFGPTRNPWDPPLTPSGSSGGSAAAVAAGMVPMAHANDLGGSIRYPASACGLFGLKPTRARATHSAPSTATSCAAGRRARRHPIGPRRAALLDATSGPALGDPYDAPPPVRPFAAEVGAPRVACASRSRPAHRVRRPRPRRLRRGDRRRDAPVRSARARGRRGRSAALDEYRGARSARCSAPRRLDPRILDPRVRVARRKPARSSRSRGHSGRTAERSPAAAFLLAIDDVQRLSRKIAQFLTDYDVWAHPTLGEPPVPLGEMVSTADDPLGARARQSHVVGFGCRREHHRQPGDVGAALLERGRRPDRRALPRPVRRRSDVAAARVPTGSRGALAGSPSGRARSHRRDRA